MIIEPKTLSGHVTVPPSKSHAHRAIICAALSSNDTIIHNVAMSEDINATISALRQLGAKIEVDNDTLHVSKFDINKKITEHITIDCNESGSTLRFMIPIALVFADKVTFIGSGRLPKRSLQVYFDIFDKLDIKYSHGEDYLPLTVEGNLSKDSGDFYIRGDISSQFITGLLLAMGITNYNSSIYITTSLESKPYVDITQMVMEQYGVKALYSENKSDSKEFTCAYNVSGMGYTSSGIDRVSGDWSQSGFHILAGLNGDITINGLDLSSPQGDKEIFNIIKQMDADICEKESSIICRKSKLKAIDVDVSDIPDMAVVIAGAMAVADGKSIITGAKRLRLKESDRIETVIATINSLGGQASADGDNIVIIGKDKLAGGKVKCHNDHRIAMLAGALSTYCENPVEIDDKDCVNKSYPDYWNDLISLGGKIIE